MLKATERRIIIVHLLTIFKGSLCTGRGKKSSWIVFGLFLLWRKCYILAFPNKTKLPGTIQRLWSWAGSSNNIKHSLSIYSDLCKIPTRKWRPDRLGNEPRVPWSAAELGSGPMTYICLTPKPLPGQREVKNKTFVFYQQFCWYLQGRWVDANRIFVLAYHYVHRWKL